MTVDGDPAAGINAGMTEPEPKPRFVSNPTLAAIIGICGVGLLVMGVWKEAIQNRDWWAFAVNLVLGLVAIAYAFEVLVLARKKS